MAATVNTRWAIGKLLISLVAVFTSVSPYLADWNETHIYNSIWTPHAKFHNAQTMVLGALLGLLAIYCLWFRRALSDQQKLNKGVVLASLFWLAQLPATFFPGTALTDPGINSVKMPVIFGVEFNQLTLNITVIFPLLILGYYLESRSLKKAEA
ncbi:MAG: acetyltransferase [Acidobacteriota bacterium]|nr:acetyltransferase [Acidobacteriota bacterium]